jgi:hypothetical protein
VAKELSQPERRKYRTFHDQHGRLWGSTIDITNGHSCGPWEAKFEAPWLPDFKYIHHHPTDDRLIVIDYDRNVLDAKDAMDAYDDVRLKTAMNQYGSAFTSKLGKTYDEDPPELKQLVGGPPFPVAWSEAAQEGNKWVLGFTNVIPSWAYPLLAQEALTPRKYLDADEEAALAEVAAVEEAVDLDEAHDPEATGGKRVPVRTTAQAEYTGFVKEMVRLGKNLKEIGALWRERKTEASV